MKILKDLKKIKQRGTRGVSDEDLYNVDYWIGKVIVNSLKEFKKSNRSGFPVKLNKAKWEKTLDDMIEGWEKLSNWDDISMEIYDKYLLPETRRIDFPIKDMVKREITDEKLDEYKKEVDRELKKAQKKASLLIKNFGSLWN